MRLRLGAVGELLELCEGTHPGKLMAAIMEAAKKERDKLLSNARSAAERMRADAQKVHAATQGLLKGSEARIAEAEAELERRLTARREELERKENERLAALARLEANARKNAEQEGAFVHQAMVEAEEVLSLICDLDPELADDMLTERLKEIRDRTENYRRDLISRHRQP
jgi:hypothetical protein